MKKLILGFAMLVVLAISATPALATVVQEETDQCNTSYEVTKFFDYQNNRVNIDFKNSSKQVEVTAKAGYVLTAIAYDYQGDGEADLDDTWAVDVNPAVVDAPGEADITAIKVTVKKDCTPVCTDPNAIETGTVVEGQTYEDNVICNYDAPEPPVATPAATPTPEAPKTLPMTGFAIAGLFALGAGATILGFSMRETRRFFKKLEDN